MLSNGLRSDLIKSRYGCLRQPERFMFKATCNANRSVITGKHNKSPVGDWIMSYQPCRLHILNAYCTRRFARQKQPLSQVVCI